jgi:hypothetical protein
MLRILSRRLEIVHTSLPKSACRKTFVTFVAFVEGFLPSEIRKFSELQIDIPLWTLAYSAYLPGRFRFHRVLRL